MAKRNASKKSTGQVRSLFEKITDKAAHLKDDLITGKDHLVELGAEKLANVKSTIHDLTHRNENKKAAKKASPKKVAKKVVKKAVKKAARKAAPKKAAGKKSGTAKKRSVPLPKKNKPKSKGR